MKKSVLATISFFGTTLLIIAISASSNEKADSLTENPWKFKSAASADPSTTHYLTTLYQGSDYHFSEDHTFTGSFFGLSITGNWTASDDTLALNKGTDKEEMFRYTVSSGKELILEGTERGNKVLISFIKE